MKYKKIYLISLVLFVLIIGVYYFIENKYSSKTVVEPLDKDYAAVALKQAQEAMSSVKPDIPKVDTDTVEVYETQAIKLVKNKNFVEVSEKPVDPMTQLAELARSKNKVYVNLSEKDLNKKINLYDNIKKSEKINTIVVPEMGKEVSSLTPVYAPCDYKVFKSSSEWNAFLAHNKVKDKPDTDFKKENILIIVSKSELSPGIFNIDSFEKKEKNIIVKYRVNVLEIAEDNPDSQRNFYSVIKIPKGYDKIELKQIQ